MATTAPVTELDARYSSEGATATSWEDARAALESAELFWFTTVRPDGRPHITPLLAVWHDGALHICTGENEQKRRNLAENGQCTLLTGTNTQATGLDLVVEGVAERVTDPGRLGELAAAWEAKYGPDWHFDVVEGGFQGGGEDLGWVYRVAPVTAYGFGKGGTFSHTRWRF